MKFLVNRSSTGSVSKDPPCPAAQRAEESPAFPGEYSWYLELETLDDLLAFLEENHGLGLFVAEGEEEYPTIEIFDEDEDD
jgi:hypothetical protein